MGWDAHSTPERKSKAVMADFKAAAERVKAVAGTADFFLEHGGLDCSDCAVAIENATREDAWSELPWPPEFVKDRAENARWNGIKMKCDCKEWDIRGDEFSTRAIKYCPFCGKPLSPDKSMDNNNWAILSAKEFLETCAKHGLGIRFSF